MSKLNSLLSEVHEEDSDNTVEVELQEPRKSMGKMFDINENDEIDMSQLTSQHELDSINQR